MVALPLIGLGQLTQSSGILTELQQRSPPHLRGRLLGLFTMCFVGLVPLGGLTAGWLADGMASPALALRALGAALAVFSTVYLWQWARAQKRAG